MVHKNYSAFSNNQFMCVEVVSWTNFLAMLIRPFLVLFVLSSEFSQSIDVAEFNWIGALQFMNKTNTVLICVT